MLSCHLCMDCCQLRYHSLALEQASPLPNVRSTDIIVWRRASSVMVIERVSRILPKHDKRNSGRRDRRTESKTITGSSSSSNPRRGLQEYEMHLPDHNDCTQYPSYHISLWAKACDELGNVLRGLTFQDRQIPPSLGNDTCLSRLRSIQQAIWPGDPMEWQGGESPLAHDCSSFRGNSFQLVSKPKYFLLRSPVVHQELRVLSPYGRVPVPYRSHDWVHGELSRGLSLSDGCFQSIPRQ